MVNDYLQIKHASDNTVGYTRTIFLCYCSFISLLEFLAWEYPEMHCHTPNTRIIYSIAA